MLSYLHVKNWAIIDELEVEFNEGLNVLTGETGAGKSIIIGSIQAVLGGKISQNYVGKFDEYALIEAIFQVETSKINQYLLELDIPIDEELLISRKINKNGRSVFRINGRVVNTITINKIKELIIDIHSQHEHQSLLNKRNHILLLDRYIGEPINEPLFKLGQKVKKYLELKNELEKDTMNDEQRRREISFLQYEIEEIESNNLTIGEDKILQEKLNKMSKIQKIKDELSIINNLFEGNGSVSGIISMLNRCIESINKIHSIDKKLDDLKKQLDDIDILLSEFIREANDYLEELNIDEEEFYNIERRINIINQLKMKHGNTIEDILKSLDLKKKELDKYINYEEHIKKIKINLEKIEIEIYKLCEDISKKRIEAAKKLSKEISQSIDDLNLKKTQFNIMINKKDNFNTEGYDDVEFMISSDNGNNFMPIIKIASGGELSRIMLAIKSILADIDEIETLIFDEIDTGISGRTAQMVAEKMNKIAKKRQIICITHLPQIAAMADTHFLLEKNNNGKAIMKTLNNNEITLELARLIGGAKITQSVINSAKEMKRLANDLKK